MDIELPNNGILGHKAVGTGAGRVIMYSCVGCSLLKD